MAYILSSICVVLMNNTRGKETTWKTIKDQCGCAPGWPEKKERVLSTTFYEILIQDTAAFHELMRIDEPQFHHLVELCPVRCRGKVAGKELQVGYTDNSACGRLRYLFLLRRLLKDGYMCYFHRALAK